MGQAMKAVATRGCRRAHRPALRAFRQRPLAEQPTSSTIAKWPTPAPPGDAPTPRSRSKARRRWEIQPDIVINGAPFTVAAKPKANVIEWTYITVPSGLKEDTWITSMEIRPSELAVTHHICVFFKPHTEDTQYNTPVWADRPRDEKGRTPAEEAGINGKHLPDSVLKGADGVQGCYVPGQFTQNYALFHSAKLIKAGTDVVFQLHYTPVGRDVVDRPRLGLTVAKPCGADFRHPGNLFAQRRQELRHSAQHSQLGKSAHGSRIPAGRRAG
jgi:hypothetical protein